MKSGRVEYTDRAVLMESAAALAEKKNFKKFYFSIDEAGMR